MTAIASIFDPLRLLTPATLPMKLFLQELWDRKMDRDDKLSLKEMQRWKVIMNKLKKIDQIEVPKFGGPTIRLELMSTLIGVRSHNFIQKQMKLHKNTERILWTDSKCVLHWIKNKDGNSFKNRIEEMLADSNISFRYINTKDNPADLPTRGISFDDLKDNQLWWHGARWLSQDKICWPTWEMPILYKTDDPENTKQEILYEVSGIAQECKQKEMPPFGIDETK